MQDLDFDLSLFSYTKKVSLDATAVANMLVIARSFILFSQVDPTFDTVLNNKKK